MVICRTFCHRFRCRTGRWGNEAGSDEPWHVIAYPAFPLARETLIAVGSYLHLQKCRSYIGWTVAYLTCSKSLGVLCRARYLYGIRFLPDLSSAGNSVSLGLYQKLRTVPLGGVDMCSLGEYEFRSGGRLCQFPSLQKGSLPELRIAAFCDITSPGSVAAIISHSALSGSLRMHPVVTIAIAAIRNV